MKKYLFLPSLLLLTLAITGGVYWYGKGHFSGIVSQVRSGDVLVVFHDRQHQAIRLNGIAAPAPENPFFASSVDYLRTLVAGKRVEVKVLTTLPDGLLLADVTFRHGDERLSLNREMVRTGFARAEGSDSSLRVLEAQARESSRGLWGPGPTPHPVVANPSPSEPKRSQPTTRQPYKVTVGSGGKAVYQWRDAKGQLVFSDRPLSASAEAAIGREITVTDFAEPRSAKLQELRLHLAAMSLDPAPDGRRGIAARDYAIGPNLKQKEGYLYLSGRIEGGPSCRRLTLQVSCVSDENRFASITHVAEDVGGFTSALLAGKTRVYGGSNKTRWGVTDITTRCQD
ncbi:MAG: thermonuclease family protein [Desulfuromonadales bacterium]|nr:thermonuclease family protein [Desulfuromonadales bacterium]